MESKNNNRVGDWLSKKYQLIIRNEADFSEKTTISYNYAKALMLIFFVFTVNAVLGYFLIRYVDSLFSNKKDVKELGKEVVEMTREIEALELEVGRLKSYDKAQKELMGILIDSTVFYKDSLNDETSINE